MCIYIYIWYVHICIYVVIYTHIIIYIYILLKLYIYILYYIFLVIYYILYMYYIRLGMRTSQWRPGSMQGQYQLPGCLPIPAAWRWIQKGRSRTILGHAKSRYIKIESDISDMLIFWIWHDNVDYCNIICKPRSGDEAFLQCCLLFFQPWQAWSRWVAGCQIWATALSSWTPGAL
jgi:hypothetical protein